MKIYTIAEVLELEPKTPISAIKGTLTKVWPPKTFTIKKGPNRGQKGTIQNLTLEDETGSINIKNWGEPLSKSDKGETFILESHPGKRGLRGLEVQLDNYSDKEELIISMDENAKIKGEDGEVAPSRGKNRKTNEPPPSRDPAELAAEAKAGASLATKMAIELANEFLDEFQNMGLRITEEQISSWGGQINYYLRDKGAFPLLRPKTSTPGESRDLNPPAKSSVKGAKPKMTNDDEDEIPF